MSIYIPAFFTNAYFLLRWTTGDALLPVRLIGYLLPWVGLGLLVVWSVALVFCLWKGALILSIPVSLILINYFPNFIVCAASPEINQSVFRVMSYNIHHKNQEVERSARLIINLKPDILMLQEVSPDQ